MKQPIERRLAAILAADVVAYSRLMGADEEGTHERLRAHLCELVDPKIAEHRGRIVKNTGDGFLANFSSVVDAVRCAADMQRGMEALAEPGGICVSQVVRDQVQGKLDIAFEDRGEQIVKNIARPMRVYALSPGTVAPLLAGGQPRRTAFALMITAAVAIPLIAGIVWLTKLVRHAVFANSHC